MALVEFVALKDSVKWDYLDFVNKCYISWLCVRLNISDWNIPNSNYIYMSSDEVESGNAKVVGCAFGIVSHFSSSSFRIATCMNLLEFKTRLLTNNSTLWRNVMMYLVS